MKAAARAIKKKAQKSVDWPWSTDPRSPNRPPFKPQPPIKSEPDRSQPYPELVPRVQRPLTPQDGIPNDLDPRAKKDAEDYYRRRGKKPPTKQFRPRGITSRQQREGSWQT